MYHMYILYSAALEKFYVGAAQDVESRLEKHLTNHKGFTSKAKDWKLVYSEEYSAKREALKRERQIKKWKNAGLIRDLVASKDKCEMI